MRAAIVGFPYSGKSTLFTAVSGVSRDAGNATGELLAAVKIPEPRLDWLEKLFEARKRTEATMELVDLPGSLDATEKAGLEKHLPTLRQADALIVIVRAFENPAVVPHLNKIDPARDVRLIRDEMVLADLTICAGRIEKLEKAIGKPTKERDQQKVELALLQRCHAALEQEQPLYDVVQPGEEQKLLRSFGFLTQKPWVLVANVGEADITRPAPVSNAHAVATLAVSARIEADLIQMDAADRPTFMAEYGLEALARDKIIRACFDALGMINFLTAGPEEVRAWPIPRGATAVEAAGRIHSDLARGFIKAETIAYADLKAAGSMRDAKAANKLRNEAKGYVVQDGDIMTIKFNV